MFELEEDVRALDDSVFITPQAGRAPTPPPSTSSGLIFNAPPPARNFYGNSESSDVQMDHQGLPLSPRRTRSTASQSSTASSTSHKVQCSRCGRSYGKAYLPKHVCKPK